MHWPRKKSLDKVKDRVRELTPRTSGKSLSETIQKLNRTLHGWFQYFKHGPFRDWMAGFACACEASSGTGSAVGGGAPIISAGRMPTLPTWGCSISRRPISWCVSPHKVY